MLSFFIQALAGRPAANVEFAQACGSGGLPTRVVGAAAVGTRRNSHVVQSGVEEVSAMSGHHADEVFAGSVPELYDTYMVPLIFEPYAADLVSRLRPRPLSRVLEIAAGTGVATRAK